MIKLWERFLACHNARLNVPFFSSWLRDYEQLEERMSGSSKRTLSRK